MSLTSLIMIDLKPIISNASQDMSANSTACVVIIALIYFNI